MHQFRLITILLVFAVVNGAISIYCAGHEELAGTSKEKRTVTENLPGQVGTLFKWPDFKTIPAEKFVTGDENKYTLRAKRSTIRWIYKVIDDKWLPESKKDLEQGFVMVKDEYGSMDVTHVEWEKNRYLFRISQTATVLAITIRPTRDVNAISGGTLREKVTSASELCAQIVRNIPKVEATTEDKQVINIVPEGTMNVLLRKSFDQGIVKQCDDVIVARPARPDFSNEQDIKTFSYWWRRMDWWTNGRSLGLYTLRIENSTWEAAYGAVGMDNVWFERPKHRVH